MSAVLGTAAQAVNVIAMRASPSQGGERQLRTLRNWDIAVGVLAGVVRSALTDPGTPRSRFLTNIWIELKRYGARRIQNIELSDIRGIDRVRVDGPIRLHSPLVVTALSILLESETVFEFGPDTGDTAWLLAHNLAKARIHLLDQGTGSPGADRGSPRDTTPEASRIVHLSGDSATFDFLPYTGTADLVYIEGTQRHAHIRSDTEAAFGLLSELGTIVWDGYSGDAGVYAYLNELAPLLDGPLYHILGTRLALYSRWDIVIRPISDDQRSRNDPRPRRDP